MGDSNLSWSLSRIQTFEKCAARYKYRYLDKMAEAPGPAMARGTLKHKIMEDYVNGAITMLPPELSHYTIFLDSAKQKKAQPEIQMGLKRDWTPCAFDDPDVWWRGVLDLLVLDKVQAIVYDWKTGQIYDDHDDQKHLYATAVLATYPELYQVRAIHVYLDKGKNREKTIHRDQAILLRSGYETRVARMESATEFIPNPTFMCRYCAFSAANQGPCKF